MGLTVGTKLGPYEIVAPLGIGGMGEVYRAKDTRLGREVAVKILPAHFSSDVARKQRFEREAKTISGLNHPNICVLHDVGSQEGLDYLVMELVEGESLAQRLEKGALPVEQALKVGQEIAEALDKAHRSGVIHRDLKPGNIMLTKSGAKLLDFGLARPTATSASLATMTAAATAPVTQEGTIVGTFQYMSPEQVEGKELDGRSDIFSLGAVLYEMLTGRRAFDGKSQLSVASAILEKEPEAISVVKPMTPANLDHAIRKCLAKDADERWQTARDVAGELKWIRESGSQAAPTTVTVNAPRKTAWLPWAACGILAVGLIAALALWRGNRAAEQRMYFTAPFSFAAKAVAIGPNGHTVAVVGLSEVARKNAVWLYEVGALNAKVVAGTEGASFPFWSPDGKYLGFFADGKLKKLEIGEGLVQVLGDAPTGRGGTWNKDGVILFTPSGRLGQTVSRIPAAGGAATQVGTLDASRKETSHRWPMFMPDGKHFLYMAFNVAMQSGADAIYLGALDSNEKKFVVAATANAGYAEPGFLLFYREKTLFAQRFDLQTYEVHGEAYPLLTDLQYLPGIGNVTFSVSNTGVLLAQTGAAVSASRLVWFDRNGKEVGEVGKAEVYGNLALAPNGNAVALSKMDMANDNVDVWIEDMHGAGDKRMTFDVAIDAAPVWSPDGKRLVFATARDQAFDLYVKDIDGAREERPIESSKEEDKYPTSWSPDGKSVLFTRGKELWTLAMPQAKSQLFLKTAGTLKNAQFSPDGRWVAYASNESGKWEIYVTSFPEAKGKWQLSNGGGEQPRWRGDGKELFFLSADGKMMATPVKTGANFDAGRPVALFQANPRELVATSEQTVYDTSKDGQRFLINTQVKNAEKQAMTVVLRWDEGLKK
jgi:eukaryotic-like serine/threonine-protein kinase